MNFKKYFIKAGNHRSGFFPNIYFGVLKSTKKIIFTDSCLYDFGNSHNLDVNKLFGLSYGYHHHNSVRFGWSEDDKEIAIHAYCYLNGQRTMKKIMSVPTNIAYVYDITVQDTHYDFTITDETGKIVGSTTTIKPKTIKWGYRLFPYFGGDNVAPHDMTIEITTIF